MQATVAYKNKHNRSKLKEEKQKIWFAKALSNMDRKTAAETDKQSDDERKKGIITLQCLMRVLVGCSTGFCSTIQNGVSSTTGMPRF